MPDCHEIQRPLVPLVAGQGTRRNLGMLRKQLLFTEPCGGTGLPDYDTGSLYLQID